MKIKLSDTEKSILLGLSYSLSVALNAGIWLNNLFAGVVFFLLTYLLYAIFITLEEKK